MTKASQPAAASDVGRRAGRCGIGLLGLLAAALALPASGWAAVNFAPAKQLGVGDMPTSVAVGDFNGDGEQDLAVANVRSANVSVLLGLGSGSFKAATSFATLTPEDAPSSVAVGDFNGDGRQDLAVADLLGTGKSNVYTYGSILPGNGTGSFGAAAPFLAHEGLTAPYTVVVGDVNRDGKQDLVLGGRSSGDFGFRAAWLGSGASTFPTGFSVSGGKPIRSVALGDFNGDGRQDIALARSVREDFTGEVSALLGDGSGKFGFEAGGWSSATGEGSTSVAIGDLNGDGRQDLAVTNYTSDNVSVFLGNGAGSFGAPRTFQTHDGPRSVVAEDFDGDGKLDLAVANAVSDDISVLPGRGGGSFGAAMNFPAGEMTSLSVSRSYGDGGRLAVGDFDCNGGQDLAAIADEADSVSLLLNANRGTPSADCDATAPRLRLKARGKQKAGKAIKVVLKSNEDASATVTGQVIVGSKRRGARRAAATSGARKTIRLRTVRARLSAGKPKVVRLLPSGTKRKAKGALRKLVRLVRRGAQAQVKIVARATDAAGNTGKSRKRIRLR